MERVILVIKEINLVSKTKDKIWLVKIKYWC